MSPTFRWEDAAVRAIAPLVAAEHAHDDEFLARAYAAAVWSCLVEPGDGVAGAIVSALGPDEALRQVIAGARGGLAAHASGVAADRLHEGMKRWRPRLDAAQIAFALRRAHTAGIRLITPDDPAWPQHLRDLGVHAPLCLWVRGDPARLANTAPGIAVVGARAATGYGEQIAGEFAAELSARGLCIVSGAAYGIDGAAHRAALAAEGLTVALVAGGVDRPYPAGHTDLLRRIESTGVVASEVPCGSAPTKWRFLQRNRLIAALGAATVVVEAGYRSGSLNTAGHAASLGRPLGAVPGPVTSGSSAGCHRLLREFDARCVTTADEVLELIGFVPGAGPDLDGDRTDDRTRILDALSSRTARDIDDIARRCGMAIDDVRAHIGLLELEGAVEARPTGWRRVGAAARA